MEFIVSALGPNFKVSGDATKPSYDDDDTLIVPKQSLVGVVLAIANGKNPSALQLIPAIKTMTLNRRTIESDFSADRHVAALTSMLTSSKTKIQEDDVEVTKKLLNSLTDGLRNTISLVLS